MLDCAACPLFDLETEGETCLHVNRPGGLALTKRALELAGLSRGTRILEVASGAGVTLDYLNAELGMDAIGLDASTGMLRLAKRQFPRGALIQGDCRRLPLAPASRQAVMMECALSLAGDIPLALDEFRRMLAPGGLLIVTDIYVRQADGPAGPARMDCLAAAHCLSGARTEDAIRSQLQASGFQIRIWQDQTIYFKQWLGAMVFKLGSLAAFYRQLVACDDEAEALCQSIGTKVKLGYYLMIAESGRSG